VVIPQPAQEQLQQIFERFEAETFGFRAGVRVNEEDAPLTGELSQRGWTRISPLTSATRLRGLRI